VSEAYLREEHKSTIISPKHTGEMRNAYKILIEKSEEKRPFKNLGVHGRIVLTCIL
jgi:hypothetical protein